MQIAARGDYESSYSLSFPHAFSGGSTGLTTGESGTGPPIKTFGGDNGGEIDRKRLSIPSRLLRGS